MDSVYKGFAVIEVLRHGRGSRPHVLRVHHAGTEAVLKDFDGCDKWFRLLLGKTLARRESVALAALIDVDGVPQFLGRIGSRALLMQYIPASPAVKVYASATETTNQYSDPQAINWSSFVNRLQTLVDTLHAMGVAHGDLRSPMNTLVTVTGSPVLVDFTAAFLRKGWPVPGRGWVFEQLCGIDRSAVTKMALRVDPDSVSDQVRQDYASRGVLDVVARRSGQSIRWLSRLLTDRS